MATISKFLKRRSRPKKHHFIFKGAKRSRTLNASQHLNSKLEDKALSAESQALSRERHLFDQLLNPLTDAINDLKTLSQLLAELDVLSSLAMVASHERWIEPVLSESVEIQITNGRHPVNRKSKFSTFRTQ